LPDTRDEERKRASRVTVVYCGRRPFRPLVGAPVDFAGCSLTGGFALFAWHEASHVGLEYGKTGWCWAKLGPLAAPSIMLAALAARTNLTILLVDIETLLIV
jgi:hypothetical protein